MNRRFNKDTNTTIICHTVTCPGQGHTCPGYPGGRLRGLPRGPESEAKGTMQQTRALFVASFVRFLLLCSGSSLQPKVKPDVNEKGDVYLRY